jgi:uncharacterized membrane protein
MRIGLFCAAAVAAASLTSTSAQAQYAKELYLVNKCRLPLRLLLNHQHAGGGRLTHGWYSIAGNSSTRLNEPDSTALMRLEGDPIYFYAEASGSSLYWEGSTAMAYNGVTYSMRQANLVVKQGRLSINIDCNNAPAKPKLVLPRAPGK